MAKGSLKSAADAPSPTFPLVARYVVVWSSGRLHSIGMMSGLASLQEARLISDS